MKRDKGLKTLVYIFVFVLVMVLGYGIEWLRWSAFCNATHTSIGFWTWILLFGGK